MLCNRLPDGTRTESKISETDNTMLKWCRLLEVKLVVLLLCYCSDMTAQLCTAYWYAIDSCQFIQNKLRCLA